MQALHLMKQEGWKRRDISMKKGVYFSYTSTSHQSGRRTSTSLKRGASLGRACQRSSSSIFKAGGSAASLSTVFLKGQSSLYEDRIRSSLAFFQYHIATDASFNLFQAILS